VRLIVCVVCSFAVLSLAGCSVPPSVNTSAAAATGSSGIAIGGLQPVTNSTIQLYSVGTTGDGTNTTPLLTKTVTTDANGNFSIIGLYSCTSATEVYLTVTGGDPTPSVLNANLAMMTALGPCMSLNSGTFIVVNELTTVAAVNALAPYMTSYTAVGSGSGDVASLDAAFTLASELVNPATGTSPGLNVPSGDTVPTDEIDTLGDVAAACINSVGGIAGDGSACGSFFSLTTPSGAAPPKNTIAALLYLAKNPELNTRALYQLISPDAPFQPQLAGLPSNFALAITSVTVPAPPVTVAVPLELSPTSITFPTTLLGSTSQAQAAMLTNTGTATVPISSIAVTGADSVDFAETNDCPAILAGGAFCTIQTSFAPQSTITPSATLQVNGGLVSVALSGPSELPAWPVTLLAANPSVYLNFNDDTTSFLDQASWLTFSAGGGTVTPRQPGFDNTTPNNTSAEFTWDAYNAAPNNTLGDIEWDVPWTMLIHVDRLNWNRTGTLTLASKGDSTTGNWWRLYLQMGGNNSQLCFERTGAGAQNGICTGYFDAMPNGFNYDIVVEDSGTGASGYQGGPTALSMYVNGLQVQSGANPQIPGAPFSNTYGSGFGYITLNASGGTGYANSTAFTSSGGGTNCTVTGTMTASGGVPLTSSGFVFSSSGCTYVPTITLTAPIGTGVTITVGLGGALMNSSTLPLMVPGYVSNGVYYGVAGTTSTQNPTYVDEFAIFPGNLNMTQVQSLFYQTKFYQGLIKALPTPVPVLVFDDDAGGDMDNFFALQMAIAIQQHGFMNLAGTVIEDGSVTCEATWRQMLDQAGLATVPLSVPSTFWENSGTGFCTTANVDTYDASTPLSNAAWESSTTMYRTIFAKYPTTPIDIVLGGPFTAMAEFMESPADSISPLTGLQLMAQNAANGGAIYAQGLGCGATSPPATTPCSATIGGDNSMVDWVSGQYVVAHNGTTPIYWIGGIPQNAGPGILSTRTSKDPMYLLTQSVGSDVRQCYDCLAVEAAVSSYFFGGVQIGYSGGTGYPDAAHFTSTGGVPNCNVQGIMTASGGVPNGIEFQWGANAGGAFTGVGWGCTSAPTVNLVGATGTGVTLTTYPTSVCGTYTITGAGSGSVTSATCSNQYFAPYSAYASESPGPSGAPMSWFINSLVDPIP
jgi:hypothetical protein